MHEKHSMPCMLHCRHLVWHAALCSCGCSPSRRHAYLLNRHSPCALLRNRACLLHEMQVCEHHTASASSQQRSCPTAMLLFWQSKQVQLQSELASLHSHVTVSCQQAHATTEPGCQAWKQTVRQACSVAGPAAPCHQVL